jgi:uncharacterized Rmd1/YagE family protein
MTGRLFSLRVEVNLVSNVLGARLSLSLSSLPLACRIAKLTRVLRFILCLYPSDSPELFWSEPSLTSLYDAVREYLEIDGRVYVLNEKLGVAGDLVSSRSPRDPA